MWYIIVGVPGRAKQPIRNEGLSQEPRSHNKLQRYSSGNLFSPMRSHFFKVLSSIGSPIWDQSFNTWTFEGHIESKLQQLPSLGCVLCSSHLRALFPAPSSASVPVKTGSAA